MRDPENGQRLAGALGWTPSVSSVQSACCHRYIFMINDDPMPSDLRESEPGHAMITIASHSVHNVRSTFGVRPAHTQKRFCGGVRYKAHNLLTFVFIHDEEKFISQLRNANHVKIEADFYQEGRRVFEFDVGGLDW